MRLNPLYFLAVLMFFTACAKKELSDASITAETTLQRMVLGDGDSKNEADKEWDGKTDKNCFDLVFPISITMPDGAVLSGDEKTLWTAVKAWYEANPDVEEKPSLNYPVEIVYGEEETYTVTSDHDMEIVKKKCSEEKEDCFDLIYPVSWTMPDSSSIIMTNEEDWEAIKDWYILHPDEKEEPGLNYPVEVIFEDGTIKAVNNNEEMEVVKKDCW